MTGLRFREWLLGPCLGEKGFRGLWFRGLGFRVTREERILEYMAARNSDN